MVEVLEDVQHLLAVSLGEPRVRGALLLFPSDEYAGHVHVAAVAQSVYDHDSVRSVTGLEDHDAAVACLLFLPPVG